MLIFINLDTYISHTVCWYFKLCVLNILVSRNALAMLLVPDEADW